jgi:hypothetical protein
VLPTQLVPDDEGKILRVRLIQKEGNKLFDPVYLFDEGSTISWIPCGRKLTCSFPGIKFYYGPDTWYGEDVSVLEMDGQFDKLEELIYVESHLSNTSAKFYGEITQQMLKNSSFPGSNNGTGLLQTIIGLKVRRARPAGECQRSGTCFLCGSGFCVAQAHTMLLPHLHAACAAVLQVHQWSRIRLFCWMWYLHPTHVPARPCCPPPPPLSPAGP